jgi:WD40 repeat protein
MLCRPGPAWSVFIFSIIVLDLKLQQIVRDRQKDVCHGFLCRWAEFYLRPWNGMVKAQSVSDLGDVLYTLEDHRSCVYAAVFSPNGDMLATQCASSIRIWNIATTGQCLRTIETRRRKVNWNEFFFLWPMVFSEDNSQFAFEQGLYMIEVHDLTRQGVTNCKWMNFRPMMSLKFTHWHFHQTVSPCW